MSDFIRENESDLTTLGQDKLVGFLASGYEKWDEYVAWAERPENHEQHLRRVQQARSAIMDGLDYLERLTPRTGS